MRRLVLVLIFLMSFSRLASAGVPAPNDPVFQRVAYVVAGALCIVAGAGFGALFGSMLTPASTAICCQRLASCNGLADAQGNRNENMTSTQSICQYPINCARWFSDYKTGCEAESSAQNRPTIVGAVVGAGVGAIGFTVFCLVKMFRLKGPESSPLISQFGKPGEIV